LNKYKIIKFLGEREFPPNPLQKIKNYNYIQSFSKNILLKSEQELVIGMGSEDYELIDKLESIAKSLESLAESHKKIADTLEWMAKEKRVVA
jgi:predicted glycosyltransferase involved in capsule biosynthesis